MRARITLLLVLSALALLAGLRTFVGDSNAQGAPNQSPSLAAQLRYIGRDPFTGRPATVNDRFIAAVEHEIERYGKDEEEAVPPPPVTGLDIARIEARAIGVDAPVQRYGLDAFGRLEVPQDREHVGWNPAFTTLPGNGGTTFFAAHYEFGGQPGVFSRLSDLAAGDDVAVTLSDGSVYRYRVTSVVDYHLASIDMGAILQGREGTEAITLMTCSGPPDPEGYQWRTVVLAERIH